MDKQLVKEQVAELYIATFGRAPDAAGLDYWTGEVVNGNLDLDGVAKSFFDQEEAQTMYGNSSNEDFVISVYENALGRTDIDASDEGVQYWVNELNEGKYSKDGFIKTVLDGAKAETGNPEDAQLLQNRVNTGLVYSEEIGVADSPLASQVIDEVSADSTTAEDAMGTITYYKDWVSKYEEALGTDADVDVEELYAHINDDEYWADLEQTHELHFDAEPSVKFWEVDDSLWEAPENAQHEDKFNFLDNEEAWADANQYQSFHNGEFAHVDTESIFGKYEESEDSSLVAKDVKGFGSEDSDDQLTASEVKGFGYDEDEKGFGSYGDKDKSIGESDDYEGSDDYEAEHISDEFVDGFSVLDFSSLSFNEAPSELTYSESDESELDYDYESDSNVECSSNNDDIGVSGVSSSDTSVDALA
jgi:hypothetical protein